MKNIKKVLVLMGGSSSEREVSLRSGSAVAKALTEAGYETAVMDVTRENVLGIAALHPDAVYIALHGKGGEDGQIQGLLDWLEIPYTGPGVCASAICMDKIMTKDILVRYDISTPDYTVLEEDAVASMDVDGIQARFGFPLVVKASSQGSSIGVEIVKEKDALLPTIRRLLAYGDRIMIERMIEGCEVTVPIIGNRELTVFPLIEITASNEFYDYQSKYTPGMSRHIIPARISPSVAEAVAEEAKRAYRATGCRGIARVDVMIDREGKPYVIELNTSPGMTETSLFPDAAAHAGVSFPALVTRVLECALEGSKQ